MLTFQRNPRRGVTKRSTAQLVLAQVGQSTGSPAATATWGPDYLQANDLVLAAMACGAGLSAPTTSGYTGLYTSGLRLGLYWKLMGTTPDQSVSFPGTINSGTVVAALGYRGIDPAIIFDVALTSVATSGSPNAPAITPATDDCYIAIFAGSNGLDASVGNVTNYVGIQNSADGATADATIAAFTTKLSGGAGASHDPPAWDAWASTNYNAVTVALRSLQGIWD